MKRLGLVRATTLGPFIRYLDTNGIDLAPHFQSAHITRELVQTDDRWLPKQQVYRFLADVASTHRVESLGLMVGDQICVADLGRLGEEIYRCTTLGDGCRRFAELVPQFAEGNTCSVDVGKTATWFGYRTTDHRKGNRDHADHYGLMMLLSVVRVVAGYWVPGEITIQTGPCEAFSQHPAWAKTRVQFNAESTALAFPSDWLDRPIPAPTAAVEAARSDHEYPSNPPEKLARSLELILASYLDIGGAPSIDKVAESLSLSVRTLKRRLAEEDETYSGLLERVRIRSAITLLRDPTKTVKEIAYILGYSGPNNFIRAFRRVTGYTPRAYRTRPTTSRISDGVRHRVL